MATYPERYLKSSKWEISLVEWSFCTFNLLVYQVKITLFDSDL